MNNWVIILISVILVSSVVNCARSSFNLVISGFTGFFFLILNEWNLFRRFIKVYIFCILYVFLSWVQIFCAVVKNLISVIIVVFKSDSRMAKAILLFLFYFVFLSAVGCCAAVDGIRCGLVILLLIYFYIFFAFRFVCIFVFQFS